MRELDTERRDNQIGGNCAHARVGEVTPPFPQLHRANTPCLSIVETDNGQRVLTAKTHRTNTEKRDRRQHSIKKAIQGGARQASWSQYEASILLYPSVFENQRVLVLLYDPALLYGNVMVNPLGTGTSRLPVVHHVFLWLWLACVSHLSAWFIRMSYSCP